MGEWTVKGDEDVPLLTARSVGRAVSLHIPTPEPVLMTVEQAEHARQVIAAAIAAAQAGDSPQGEHRSTESRRGEDSV